MHDENNERSGRRPFVVLALIVLCCVPTVVACSSVDPMADCLAGCEHQRDAMCNGYTGAEDCDMRCADAATSYDELRARAAARGCGGEFDTSYACVTGGDVCVSTFDRCLDETTTFQTCFDGFCIANPSDPACL